MDNLKVFKKMGRFVAAQINMLSESAQITDQTTDSIMGLENQLIVDAWNTITDRDGVRTVSSC
ncbi:hypothetical protein TOI97_06380 [Denitrificimonas sp. JX-1]|uniref:Motility protein n=1 Tax=Denitrificimonas halotolerans TaxID=3098930 RepID=A0ABU5GQR0_9GAMM|nr:hypothetical protein [Denitrificimonas sp. JX-1]MDY7219194.1 hypothetical protein [Denitrificimonas sp. JX-1]